MEEKKIIYMQCDYSTDIIVLYLAGVIFSNFFFLHEK